MLNLLARRCAPLALVGGAALATNTSHQDAFAEPVCGGLKRRTTIGALGGLRQRLDTVEGHAASAKLELEALSTRLARIEDDVGMPTVSITEGVGRGGQATVELNHPSGSKLTLYRHGGTVTSLTDPSGRELLFVSQEAVYNGKKAIRGGIPLVFPVFGAGPCDGCEALPSHGFGRTSEWQVASVTTDEASGAAVLRLELSDSEATHAHWPHRFTAVYELRLGSGQKALGQPLLTSSLMLRNDNATRPEPTNPHAAPVSFRMQSLLHTYLRVPDVQDVTVRGLEGSTFATAPYDFTPGKGAKVEGRDAIQIRGEVDQIHRNAGAPVTIWYGAGDDARGVTVEREAQIIDAAGSSRAVEADVTLWNPWSGKAARTKDMGDDEYTQFVCVEPGIAIAPGTGLDLQPGETACLTQHIHSQPI